MPETLTRFYPSYPLLQWGGRQHPITVFPSIPAERTALESPLGVLRADEVYAEDYFAPDWHQDCARDLRDRFRRMRDSEGWNGPTFALDRLRSEHGAVRLDAGPGRYLQSMATSDALDLELSAALGENPDEPVPLAALPKRRWLTEQVRDPVVDGSRRSAALSLSMTVSCGCAVADIRSC